MIAHATFGDLEYLGTEEIIKIQHKQHSISWMYIQYAISRDGEKGLELCHVFHFLNSHRRMHSEVALVLISVQKTHPEGTLCLFQWCCIINLA